MKGRRSAKNGLQSTSGVGKIREGDVSAGFDERGKRRPARPDGDRARSEGEAAGNVMS